MRSSVPWRTSALDGGMRVLLWMGNRTLHLLLLIVNRALLLIDATGREMFPGIFGRLLKTSRMRHSEGAVCPRNLLLSSELRKSRFLRPKGLSYSSESPMRITVAR